MATQKVSLVSHPQMQELPEYKMRIRDKARGLFMQFGIRSVSMDDIASALGSSKKTIYQYYSDKGSLVYDVVESILCENYNECRMNKQRAENAIHEGFLAIDLTAELFKQMNPLLINDLMKYHPEAFKLFEDYKNNFLYELLRGSLAWGINDGLYREDVNVEIISRFRVQSIIIPFQPEFYHKVKSSLADTQKELFLLFLYGLVTPKGYKVISKYRNKKNKTETNAKA